MNQSRVLSHNRRARFDYFITETLEAGVVLLGSEVKSLRKGGGNINDAYVSDEEGRLVLMNSHIAPYTQANQFNHEERRHRALLLHKKEIKRMRGLVQRKGVTLIPLSLYLNKRGVVKIELGVAEGKKQHDKRATIKERDWQRDKARIMKVYG